MESRTMVLMTLLQGRNRDADAEHGLKDTVGKDRVWHTERVTLIYIHTTICNGRK